MVAEREGQEEEMTDDQFLCGLLLVLGEARRKNNGPKRHEACVRDDGEKRVATQK